MCLSKSFKIKEKLYIIGKTPDDSVENILSDYVLKEDIGQSFKKNYIYLVKYKFPVLHDKVYGIQK